MTHTDVPAGTGVAAAFAAARAAGRAWAATDPADRAGPFRTVADDLLRGRDEALRLIRSETGKATADAIEEVLDASLSIRYYARSAARLLRPRRRPGALPLLTRTVEHRRPHGVVAVITPWNYPLSLAADVVPALLAGNTVVHKPDSRTAGSSLLIRELAIQSGLDPALWQVVYGTPEQVGDALIDGADFVSFTGSTRAGREIGRRCAERMIGCSLELGGKNPMIVLDDADLDRAVPAAVRASFGNAGQLCIGAERIYLHRGIETEFLRRFVPAAAALRLGDADDATADVGGLFSAERLDRVQQLVDRAIRDGAELLTGGRRRPEAGPCALEPTVLAGASPEAEINTEEIFGPVVTVTVVDDDAEAIRMANAGDFGLNASVFSTDSRRARRIAAALQTGVVNINEGYAAGYGSAAPVGGRKQSGSGRRHGPQGLLQYTVTQTVAEQRLLGFDPPAGLDRADYLDLLSTATRVLRRLNLR